MASPVLLSFSSIFSLVGGVLVVIAFATNNWQECTVNREAVFRKYNNDFDSRASLTRVNQSATFFSRTYGLFRECFSEEVPNGSGTYTDFLGNQCRNIGDYQIPEDAETVRSYGYYELIRMHMMRTLVALYIVGIALLVICLFTGVSGCWKRRISLLLSTGIMLMFATLSLIASVAIWHGVDHIERELINTKPFYQSWPQILKERTRINYGWSYMVAWVGIGLVLIASVLLLLAHRKMKEEERREMEAKSAPYMLPSYHDKMMMMMPYAQGYYGNYGPQPMYATYGSAPTMQNGYYGYLNYGI